MAAQPLRRLRIGTYPVAGQGTPIGRGEGIWSGQLDPRSGVLSSARQACSLAAPSFVVAAPDGLVYATNEGPEGGLTVLREDGSDLAEIASVPTAGADPCHLLVDAERGLVLVANYSSGSVAVVRLGPEGLPVGDEPSQLLEFSGAGPRRVRQDGAHAHYLLRTSDPDIVLLCDLGSDCVRRLRIDSVDNTVTDDGVAVVLPAGAGPRHAVFSPGFTTLYVLGELDGRLHSFAWDQAHATAHPLGSLVISPDADSVPQLAHLTLEAGVLSCGSRGDDVITNFGLTPGGLPARRGSVRLPGRWPRHHAAIDGYLVVAQQNGGGVVSLDASGTVCGQLDIPSPACICPVPQHRS